MSELEPEAQISNNLLARWLSAETLGSLLIMALTVGISYQALASETETTKRKVATVEKRQREMTKSLKEIEIDTAVIRNSQENFQRHYKNQLDEQKQKINRILDLLERRS